MKSWLCTQFQATTLVDIVKKRWKVHNFKRKIICMSISCLCYKIWHVRNEAIWQQRVSTVDMLMKRIRQEVNTRTLAIYPVKAQTNIWFRDLFHQLLVLFCFFWLMFSTLCTSLFQLHFWRVRRRRA